MTTPPNKQPPATVAVTPTTHRHIPAAAPPPPPAPSATAIRVAPAPHPHPVSAAPIARPIQTHPIQTRPVYTAPAPTHPPRSGHPQHSTPQSGYPYNGYQQQPRGYYQPPRQYYSQPQRGRYEPPHRNNGILAGFFGGLGLSRLFGGNRHQSYPAGYGPTGYGPQGAPYGANVPDPSSMPPGKFTSLMNAAIEGRENDRTITRTGENVPTTALERQYFKQIVYAMAQRDGKQIDPQGMFTPEVLSAVERGQIDPRSLGSDLRHFSDSFSRTGFDSRGTAINSPLANDLYNNYEYLRSQYANEYRQSQQFEAQNAPPQHIASYQQPPAHYHAPRSNSTIIPIFGMRF